MESAPDTKEILELVEQNKIDEAREKIMQLRVAMLELKEENASLRDRVRDLEERLESQSRLYWDGRFYWRNDPRDPDNPEKRDGPFCQLCHDKDNKTIRLIKDGYALYCAECGTSYYK